MQKKCDMQNFRKIYVVHTELWPFKVSLKSLTNTKMTKKSPKLAIIQNI